MERIFLAVLLFCACGLAQDLPEAPSAHRFWDRTNKILFLSHAALEATDFGITHHNLSHGGRELDSMGKALCESGTAGQLVFFGGRMAGVAGITYALHRLGLHKLERGFFVVADVDSSYGVIYSFAHR